MWKGLGIFFDSFDNDNKHNNPYIMAMVNDGTKVYDHQKYEKFLLCFLLFRRCRTEFIYPLTFYHTYVVTGQPNKLQAVYEISETNHSLSERKSAITKIFWRYDWIYTCKNR